MGDRAAVGRAVSRAYDWILAAARWAEQHHTPPDFVSTAPELYAIASRVAAGTLVFDDMPDPGNAPWSRVVMYLETQGYHVCRDANRRAGNPPLFVNGVES